MTRFLTAPVLRTGTTASELSRRGVILQTREVTTLQEKLAIFWAQAQEKVRPLYTEVKEHGLSGLRKVIREQGPRLWIRVQEQARAAWQWLTAQVEAVPGSKQALVHSAVALAVVSMWLVFEMIPGAMAAALSLTMIVAFLALIVAFLAYGGVATIFSSVQTAANAAA
jgi:hypothetical protein